MISVHCRFKPLMYFNLLQVQAKNHRNQMGQLLTRPKWANGVLCLVENICLTKVDDRNSILCKKVKKQKKPEKQERLKYLNVPTWPAWKSDPNLAQVLWVVQDSMEVFKLSDCGNITSSHLAHYKQKEIAVAKSENISRCERAFFYLVHHEWLHLS